MEYLGVAVNGISIIIGVTIGLFFTKINEKMKETIMMAIGLVVLVIGLTMAFESQRIVVVILSLISGALIGEKFNWEQKLNRIGEKLEKRFKQNNTNSKIAEGFVTATLIFGIGAMAVVGSLDSGLRGDHGILFTKSFIDGFVSLVLTTTLGIGVIFSVFPIVLYQGAIVFFATQIHELITDQFLDMFIIEMTATGGILIVALGLNMLKITSIRVANLLPSLITVGFILYAYIQLESLMF